jgi:hypothetical protein
VKGSQLGARLHAYLLDERPARPAVCLERLGLTAAAVEGEHQPAVQMLAQRLFRHGRLQFGDQVGVPGEGELGVDPGLEGRPAPLLEPGDLSLRELLVGEV